VSGESEFTPLGTPPNANDKISVMDKVAEIKREEIYRRLREDVLSCVIMPGQSLHENDLAERFGVSKSPIRDALMRLEADGLVTVQSRKGYRVSPVSVADADDMYELRAKIEAAVMGIVAGAASDEELASLDRFRSPKAWDNNGGFIAYNREFHRSVANLCRNKRLKAVALDLIEQFNRFTFVSLAVIGPGHYDRPLSDHVAIIDQLQAREPKKAARLVEQHLERGRKRVVGALRRAAVVA
jgi:GntR family transcriptional regulator, rspAB operon transcriptional repressor